MPTKVIEKILKVRIVLPPWHFAIHTSSSAWSEKLPLYLAKSTSFRHEIAFIVAIRFSQSMRGGQIVVNIGFR